MKNSVKNNLPLVSIVVPCRNEEKFISRCLDSIVANTYLKDKLEVLLVDGVSEDETRDIIERYAGQYPFIRGLDNPKKITPVAFNIGVKNSRGNVIMVMSAHATYKKDYISKCVKYLSEYNADNVGGVMITLPRNNTFIGRAIVIALSHRFGVGNSSFRIGSKEPKWVDTVFGGCYKKGVFDKIGLFNENLVRNQDDEFNFRLIKNGGKILLVPEIVSYYYARSKLSQLWRQYFQYGYFKVRVVQEIGTILTWRQLIPAIFVGSLVFTGVISFFSKFFLWLFLLIVGSYLFANFGFSLSIAIKKGLGFFSALPAVFATLHFSYGLGYLKGIWDFAIRKRHLKKKIEDVPLTR